jgi:serine O-acetyltransferase
MDRVNWQQDLSRYKLKYPFLKEQSIWAIWWYRKGDFLNKKNGKVFFRIRVALYWLIFRLIETVTGISIPPSVKISGGLRIWHFGNIFIHGESIIGRNCTIRQGVTIGNRYNSNDAPIIGDNVEIGAYAQILGSIKIGDNCKIGAMTVVLTDIPANSTVVGNPGKVIHSSIKDLSCD